MDAWDAERRPVRQGYRRVEVQAYTSHAAWQYFRLKFLKGAPTREKLRLLEEWYDGKHVSTPGSTKWQREVQVGNYLGALRRGGQLDQDNRVRK